MKKRLLSIILTVCLVLTLLPTVALAADTTGTYGAFSVTYNDSSTTPTYSDNTLTLGSGTYTVAMKEDVTQTTTDRIVVSSGVTANITLNGVNIDVSSVIVNFTGICAFDMTGATVNLILAGTNTLKSGKDCAGLNVPSGATLTIDGTGSLTATGGQRAAGIGGNTSTGGTVTIRSGTVTANGTGNGSGYAGAGIGGSTVNISGGIVTANGSEGSAGIGGRASGAGGVINISGGTVIANGGSFILEGYYSLGGAGIGGGGGFTTNGAGGEVTITGGSVKATGGNNGAGIIAAAIGAGTNQSGPGTDNGSLKNSSDVDVQLYTLTLSGVSSATAVKGLTLPDSYSYGITDMKTDDAGNLYLYLPAGKTGPVTATTATGTYTGSIAENAATLLPSYAITASSATNGSYTVKVGGSAVTSAQSGDTVTITPTANSGYELDTVSVCKTGETSTTVAVSSNTSFTMPDYAVTVSVTFKAAISPLDLTGVGYNVAAGTLTGTTTNMQYSLDGGSGWQDCAAGNTTGLTFIAGTVKVRQKDNTTNESTIITITAPAASSAPTLESKTYNSVTLTAMTGYEYSRDGGTTWQDSNVFSGLSGSTAYSFLARIKATATTLPGTASTALSVTTSSASSGGTSSGGGSSTPSGTGTPVIVDGKTQNIGTEKKSGDTTTVTVDQSKLGEQISSAAASSSVVVPVNENSSATAALVVKNIDDMAAKGMTLIVQTGNVAYNLNTSAIDTAALTAAFPGADMSKVPFNVTIHNSSISVAGETLVLSPVAFTVTATYNGKTVSVDTFSAYINRVIEVTAKQKAKITTAVVVNADGSTRHVPTNVIEKDGKYYAIINSRTNSTYALIQNEVTFADATGKWYEAAVNEMGSRKIIEGRSASVFDGEASITRAEFAAILVRALGLPADGTSSFSDVPADAWYTGAVATAVKYGLTEGKGDNRFDPSAAITRQEAMLMLQRAAVLTEFTGARGNLSSFTDANSVGTWSLDAVKWSVGSGLIVGSGGLLRPNDNISRAESATVILRLLQKTGLVDVRSKA